jgi:hypothetical protein
MSRQRRKDWHLVRKGACVWVFQRCEGALVEEKGAQQPCGRSEARHSSENVSSQKRRSVTFSSSIKRWFGKLCSCSARCSVALESAGSGKEACAWALSAGSFWGDRGLRREQNSQQDRLGPDIGPRAQDGRKTPSQLRKPDSLGLLWD